MKKQLKLAFSVLIITISLMFVSCKGNSQKENGGEEMQMSEIIYTCPMHPGVEQKEPGNCPICGMTLVEKKSEISHEEHMHE